METLGLMLLALWFLGVMIFLAWQFATDELAARERYDIKAAPVQIEVRRHRPAAVRRQPAWPSAAGQHTSPRARKRAPGHAVTAGRKD